MGSVAGRWGKVRRASQISLPLEIHRASSQHTLLWSLQQDPYAGDESRGPLWQMGKLRLGDCRDHIRCVYVQGKSLTSYCIVIYLFTHLSIYLSPQPPHSSIHSFTYKYTHLPTHSYTHPSIHSLPTHLSIIDLSIYPPTHPPIHISIHMPTYLCIIHPSIRLPVH